MGEVTRTLVSFWVGIFDPFVRLHTWACGDNDQFAMKLNFFGDISPYNIDPKRFRFDRQFEELTQNADFNIGNLECPISEHTEKEAHQVMYMAALPESLTMLEPFDILSLANNHIRDFGTRGLLDTIDALKHRNFQYFGAGQTVNEAIAPALVEKDGMRMAIFGATRYANATAENGGGTAPDALPLLKKQIKKLKREGYFVVLYLHWGYEYVRIPSPRERRIAHRCIDAGADLILGAHPHIYQGIETYKGKTIAYSLGNFIFHSSVYELLSPLEDKSPMRESFAISVDIKNDMTYDTKIHGYTLSDTEVHFYDTERNTELIHEVNAVSELLRQSWWKYLKAYYRQAYDISEQNIKMRRDFQNAAQLGFGEKLKLYLQANRQDLKNRVAHLVIKMLGRGKSWTAGWCCTEGLEVHAKPGYEATIVPWPLPSGND